MSALRLYTYFRSSAAFRVRIALNLKGLDYQAEFVHLLKDGGEQSGEDYLALNPQGLIPSLSVAGPAGDQVLTQSLAIIEYLEERYPQPSLLPKDLEQRAFVRSLALMISCDIHPLNNLRLLAYLKDELSIDEAARKCWYCHWLAQGFDALEQRIVDQFSDSGFCVGQQAGLADLFLIPQFYNALRYGCDVSAYPVLQYIYDNCMAMDAFYLAAPEQQPDHEL